MRRRITNLIYAVIYGSQFFFTSGRMCFSGTADGARCAPYQAWPYLYLRWSRSELRTTEMELKAMAADAIIGLSLPSAATGIATVL